MAAARRVDDIYRVPVAHYPAARRPMPFVMMAAALAAGGCAEMRSTTDDAANAPIRCAIPAVEVVSPILALTKAQEYVREHPGSDFAIGSGDSMLPYYRDRTLVILERPAICDLKPGQMAVFMSSNGRPIAHVLLRRTAWGWMTRAT